VNAKPQTKAQLIAALDQIRQAVEADDSFEGFIEYTISQVRPGPTTNHRTSMIDDCRSPGFAVKAFWRVGNSQGQGGSISIGNDL